MSSDAAAGSSVSGEEDARPTQRLSVRGRRLVVAGAAIAGSAIVGGTVNFFLPSVLGLTKEPLLVNVEDDPGAISTFANVGQTLALPATARGQDLGQPQAQGCADFHRWGQQFGSVDSGSTKFRVTVQGNSSRPVLISQLRVKIVQRGPATEGAYAACDTAGNASIRPMSVDLDGASNVVQPTDPQQPAFGVTVGQGEIELFDIEAKAQAADVDLRWTLEITVVVNGRTQVLEVQDRGHPFETVGYPAPSTKKSIWLNGWSPAPPFR